MKRRPKHPLPEETSKATAANAEVMLQIKVWLAGISPMVWRRLGA